MMFMELPFDILDHIFSFLKFHPKALLACSKAHPVLSQIVERYRFHHIIIHPGHSEFTHRFNPPDLRRYLMDTPRISKHVTVLQIKFNYSLPHDHITLYLEEIASLLPMFPVLECIMLPDRRPWLPLSYESLPHAYRTAVENCFKLPTLQEVHVGSISFPLSILNNHANINYLSLLGPPIIETESLNATYPKIKTLALEGFIYGYSDLFVAWAKRHIVGLRSLKYDLSCHEMVFEFFKICSDTLEDLHLCFFRQGAQIFETGPGLFNISSLPHLRHLTMNFWFGHDSSHLPRAVEMLKTAPTLQKLTIEISLYSFMRGFNKIDLSPLRILTDSLRFPHVDLYMLTGSSDLPVTHTIIHSLLLKHEGLMELIERGILVAHPEEAAPSLSRSYIAD